MSRAGWGSMFRSGRGQNDDPPPRLEEYRAERASVDLASGDFRLSHANGETVLLAIAPTSADSRVVRKEGPFTSWSRDEWRVFLGEAEKFNRSDMLDDLESIREKIMEERISREGSVFNDDADESPVAVHTLQVHYSPSGGYIKVRGPATYKHRKELRSLGLHWVPSVREWVANYSSELLPSVVGYVEENSRSYDPGDIGYERCPECGRWCPISSTCPCSLP